ncbi:MAG: hypothetical protein AABW71_01830 [Nanoarchaeota archaeon]
MKKRGQLGFSELVPWIIAIGALVLVIILYIAFNDKGSSIIESLKNMWRFGG